MWRFLAPASRAVERANANRGGCGLTRRLPHQPIARTPAAELADDDHDQSRDRPTCFGHRFGEVQERGVRLPRNDRLDALRPLVARAVHKGRNGVRGQVLCAVRHQQRLQLLRLLHRRVEPAVEVLRMARSPPASENHLISPADALTKYTVRSGRVAPARRATERWKSESSRQRARPVPG